MNRKLASIQRITKLSPIDGADKIEVADILGWKVVVAKSDNFKVGDLVVYCEIDSILPDKPEFEFLRERKFKIKTIKLRGQVGQGICFNLDSIPEMKQQFAKGIGYYWDEGDDVTDIIGVKKYDPLAEWEKKEFEKRQLIHKNRINKFFSKYKWYRNLLFKPERIPFPSFIKKTDEDRIQLFPNICEEYKGFDFQYTEKLDGTSATYFITKNKLFSKLFKPYIFCVCSRNYQLIKNDNSVYWKIAKQLKEKLTWLIKQVDADYVVLQGEIIGVGIQGNKYNLKEIDFYLFNVFYDDEQLDNELLSNVAEIIEVKTVPILGEITIKNTIQDMVNFSVGQSAINSKTKREGLVFRNYGKGLSFKVINPDFLLQYDE